MKTFKEVTTWQQQQFGVKRTIHGAANHLKQEAQEIIQAIEESEHILGPAIIEHLEEEIADCIFMVWQMADLLNLSHEDLMHQVSLKLSKNKNRTWEEPNEEGIINHSTPTIRSNK